MYTLENFIGDLYSCGKESQEGLFEVIKDGVKSLWKRIMEIWGDFISKVKRFFIKINPFLSKQEKIFRCSKPDWEKCDMINIMMEEMADSDFEIIEGSVEESMTLYGNYEGENVYTASNLSSAEDGVVMISTSKIKSYLNTLKLNIKRMNNNIKKSSRKINSDQNQGFLKKVLYSVKSFISMASYPFKLLWLIITTVSVKKERKYFNYINNELKI